MTDLSSATWPVNEVGLAMAALSGPGAEVAWSVRGLPATAGTLTAEISASLPAVVTAGECEDGIAVAVRRFSRRRAVVVGPDGLHVVRTRDLLNLLLRPSTYPLARLGAAGRDRPFTPTELASLLPSDTPVGFVHRVATEQGQAVMPVRPRTRSIALACVLGATAAVRMGLVLAIFSGLAALDRGGDAWKWVAAVVAFACVHSVGLVVQGRLGVEGSARIKERLLANTLVGSSSWRASPGRAIGLVLEVDAIESLAWGTGVVSVVGVIEALIAGAVLLSSPRGAMFAGILCAGVVAIGVLAVRYMLALDRWAALRLDATSDLIERLTGHRTRTVQLPPSGWADESEPGRRLAYATAAAEADVGVVRLGLVWRVFVLAGATVLLAFSASAALPIDDAARTVGGLVLGAASLQAIAAGAGALCKAATAWRKLRSEMTSPQRLGVHRTGARAGWRAVVASAEGVSLRRGGSTLLRDVDMTVRAGDKILLAGSSGAGKTTLATLLAGLVQPDRGRVEHGDVALAASGHDNHIFFHSLRFNLLMGRTWPSTPRDEAHAVELCRRLGLLGLLRRMPAGLDQVVGEAGWQLSDGERARVVIARCLLTEPDLAILDDSLDGIDTVTRVDVLDALHGSTPAVLAADATAAIDIDGKVERE